MKFSIVWVIININDYVKVKFYLKPNYYIISATEMLQKIKMKINSGSN